MRKRSGRFLLCGAGVAACVTLCHAQFGRGDSSWATTGADAQRSSWVRTDSNILRKALKPDFRSLWKVKLGDARRNTFTPAAC